MLLRIESRHWNEIIVLGPEVFTKQHGFFMETFHVDQFDEIGISTYLRNVSPEDPRRERREEVVPS
jgi:dTDP-4-dehydrorhamnose 3,5-epimerase-like enzyme